LDQNQTLNAKLSPNVAKRNCQNAKAFYQSKKGAIAYTAEYIIGELYGQPTTVPKQPLCSLMSVT
jgi:hypothetical protein